MDLAAVMEHREVVADRRQLDRHSLAPPTTTSRTLGGDDQSFTTRVLTILSCQHCFWSSQSIQK